MRETLEQRTRRLLAAAKERQASKNCAIDQTPIIERLEELLAKVESKEPVLLGDDFCEFDALTIEEKRAMLHKLNVWWRDQNANNDRN